MTTRTASRSQATLLAGHFCRLLLALALTTVLGRALEPDAFGFFTLVGTVFFVAHTVFDAGVGALVVREMVRQPERERSLLELSMGWRRLSGLVLGLGVLVFAAIERDPHRRLVLLSTALLLPWMASGALMPIFRARQEPLGPEIARLASIALVLLGCFAFLAVGAPGDLFGVLLVLQALVNVLWIRWLAVRKLGYAPRPGLRGRGLRRFVTMALVLAAFTLVQTTYYHADVFLVLVLRGDTELGAYSAAFRPINALLALPGILTVPLLPVFTHLARRDRPALVSLLRRGSALALGVGSLAAVAGALLAPDLISLLYGGRYSVEPLAATEAFRWLSLSLGILLAVSIFSTVLLAEGRERLLLGFAMIGLFVNLIGNLIAVPILGFTGAALVTALTNGVVAVLVILASRWVSGRSMVTPGHLLALVPAAAMALCLYWIDGSAVIRVVAGCALGAAGVLLLLGLPAARHFRSELAAASGHAPRARHRPA